MPIDALEFMDEEAMTAECPACFGTGNFLGCLGSLEYFRCRMCGIVFNDAGEDANGTQIIHG